MTTLELAQRNLSSALREAMNVEVVLTCLKSGLCDIDEKVIDRAHAQACRAIEALMNAQDALKAGSP